MLTADCASRRSFTDARRAASAPTQPARRPVHLWAFGRRGHRHCDRRDRCRHHAGRGGLRHRLLSRRAEARLLVLDEPTTSLALHHQVLLATPVRRHARAVGGALLVLHDLVIAAGACDRLALLVGGRTAAAGTPAQGLRPEGLGGAYRPRGGGGA